MSKKYFVKYLIQIIQEGFRLKMFKGKFLLMDERTLARRSLMKQVGVLPYPTHSSLVVRDETNKF